MKPSLMLAGVLALLPCACKKEAAGNTGTGPDSPAATKSSRRAAAGQETGADSHEGPRGAVRDFNSRGLIEAAEKAGEARQKATAALTAATQEATLVATLDDAATLENAQAKVAEATAEAEKAELVHAEALDAVRSHLSQFPEDAAAAAYLAYADQKAAVAAKQMEMAEIPPDTDPEDVARLELDFEAETLKLRDLRAAWKDTMPDQ